MFCTTANFVRVVKSRLPGADELKAPTTAFPFLSLFRRLSDKTVSAAQRQLPQDPDAEATGSLEHEVTRDEKKLKCKVEEDEREGLEFLRFEQTVQQEEGEELGIEEQGELSSFLELQELVKAQEEALWLREAPQRVEETKGELSSFLELQELAKAQKEALWLQKTPEQEEETQGKLSLFNELQKLVQQQNEALQQPQDDNIAKQKPRKRVTFNLDNVALPVKERELYRGREYFRCGRRLLYLRPELRRSDTKAASDPTPTSPHPKYLQQCAKKPSRIPVPRPAKEAPVANTTQPPFHKQISNDSIVSRSVKYRIPIPSHTAARPRV